MVEQFGCIDYNSVMGCANEFRYALSPGSIQLWAQDIGLEIARAVHKIEGIGMESLSLPLQLPRCQCHQATRIYATGKHRHQRYISDQLAAYAILQQRTQSLHSG